MLTIDQLLVTAVTSVVVALAVVVARVRGALKLDWSLVFGILVVVLAAGGFALWLAVRIIESI